MINPKKLLILGTGLIVASPLLLTAFNLTYGFVYDVHNTVVDPDHPLAPGNTAGAFWITRVALICILIGIAGLLLLLGGIVGFFVSRTKAKMRLKAERSKLEYFRG
jgi:hypothetical protein